jgi:hypothetical protein
MNGVGKQAFTAPAEACKQRRIIFALLGLKIYRNT